MEWLLLFWQRFYWQVYYFSMSVTCFNGLTNYRHIHKADTFIYSFLYWGKVFIDSLIVKNWNIQGSRVIQHEFEISNSSRHSYILIFSRRKTSWRDGDVLLFTQAQVIPGKNKTGRQWQKNVWKMCSFSKHHLRPGENGQTISDQGGKCSQFSDLTSCEMTLYFYLMIGSDMGFIICTIYYEKDPCVV